MATQYMCHLIVQIQTRSLSYGWPIDRIQNRSNPLLCPCLQVLYLSSSFYQSIIAKCYILLNEQLVEQKYKQHSLTCLRKLQAELNFGGETDNDKVPSVRIDFLL